ncbi:MAG: thermonuclease family protein [Alphaproteobacteria bacterium]|nr:thermonuclease family protein [Alphaproteobacteria bacterium]
MIRLVLIAMAVLVPAAATAETVAGVPRVVDGDSLVVDGRPIRLARIDAPEMKQPEGRYVLAALKRHIAGREVQCEGTDQDRYRRLVATCRIDGRSINAWLVGRGLAFAYWPFRDPVTLARRPCPDQSMPECHRTSPALLSIEDKARSAGRGLWRRDPLPTNPWCIRHPSGIDGWPIPCR